MLQPFLASLMTLLTAPRNEERGASATEYAILIAGIVIVVAAAVVILGGKLSSFFDTLNI